MTSAPWKFSVPPTSPRRPEVMLFVFGRGTLSRSPVGVQTVARAHDPRWFDAWRSGSLRNIAEQDLGTLLAQLDTADHLHLVTSVPGVVTDLSYLQNAWASAREVIELGGSLVLDVHAMRYVPGAEVAAADASLDVAREVRVVFETNPARSEHAHALHTRGMRKFGAPDLVALCADTDVALVGPAMAELADHVARGTDLATPRHAVEIAPGVRWVAVEDEHRLAELLQLNNSARVLVDDRGHDLVGVTRASN